MVLRFFQLFFLLFQERIFLGGIGLFQNFLNHLLLSIPHKMSVSGFMGYLKGKSSLMIFQKYGNMKFAYRNREFWCKGYYVDTVGKNTASIKSYIANQLKQD